MVQEGGISGGKRLYMCRFFFQFVEECGKNESTRVVVGAVSLGKIRHGENGVLENAGGIGHPGKMLQPYLRQLAWLLVKGLRREQLSGHRGALEAGLLEALHVEARHVAPNH